MPVTRWDEYEQPLSEEEIAERESEAKFAKLEADAANYAAGLKHALAGTATIPGERKPKLDNEMKVIGPSSPPYSKPVNEEESDGVDIDERGLSAPPRKVPKLVAGAGQSPEPDRPKFADQVKSPLVARHLEQAILGASPMKQGGDPEMEEAEEKARMTKLIHSMGRAGSKIGYAGTRGKIDDKHWESKIEGSNEPVTTLKGKRSAAAAAAEAQRKAKNEETELGFKGNADKRAGQKFETEQANSDPKSEASRNARATLVSMYPKIAARIRGDELKTYSAADVDRVLKEAQMDKMARATASSKNGPDSRGFELDTQKLAKFTGSHERAKRAADELRAMANQSDIPGAGLWDSQKPGFMESEDDTRAQQAKLRLIQDYKHAITGTAATPQEAEQIMKTYGMGVGTEQQFKIGVERFIQDEERKANAVVSGFSPQVRSEYHRRRDDVGKPPDMGEPSEGETIIIKNPQTGERARFNQETGELTPLE